MFKATPAGLRYHAIVWYSDIAQSADCSTGAFTMYNLECILPKYRRIAMRLPNLPPPSAMMESVLPRLTPPYERA